MVVLADELLESFFDSDLSASFRLDEPAAPIPDLAPGLFGGFVSSIMSNDNKKLLDRVADGIGKTIGKHQVSSQ